MCQFCSQPNERMEPADNKLLGPNNNNNNNEQHVGSCTLHAPSPEQRIVNQNGSSPHEPSLTCPAPTTSLMSCDSFTSNGSDYSVDVSPRDGHNLEDGSSESAQYDPKYRLPNGHLSKSNSSDEENKEDKSGHGDDGNGKDCDECPDEENESSSQIDDKDEIWDPPEAENEDANLEHSMAAMDDDDDDCANGDGREWTKPTSLDSFDEGVSTSYGFREEKQKAMEEVMNGKFKNLVSQLLEKVGIDECWVDTVTMLAWQAALFVKPDATEGKSMDPSGYVKIKCIACGSRNESRLIKGLVFKKHAAHKHMATKYTNPRLLLIQGMLGQSSGSSGLSSFSSMIALTQTQTQTQKDEPGSLGSPSYNPGKSQDKESSSEIDELVENLKASHANVILVEKSASRDVLEEVRKIGVTLVLDMKLHRLERVARCIGSRILPSDTTFNQKLKHCESLYFEKFAEEHAIVGEGGKKPSKTLMFLDGCPTRLGCTILLKGSHNEELKKIKCVVQCAVVMAYHFILETSFLVDQKAMFSTIAFGHATDLTSTDEQFKSAVFETSNSPCSEEHNADGASADAFHVPISTTDEGSSHFQGSTSTTTGSCDLEIPISNGVHVEESHHVNETSSAEFATSNGNHDEVPQKTQQGVDGPCNACYDPHMDSLSAASPSISYALEKVSMVSPATYKHMSSYIGLNGGEAEAQTAVSIPVSPTNEVTDQCDIKEKDNSKDDKLFHNHSRSLSEISTASGDARKVFDESEDCIRPKNDISSILDSESILVLMSSRNASRGTICEQSHFSHIKFYRNFDVPLGKFLQDNLFNQSLQCKACGGLPEAHFYYYAHHNKQLTIRVKQLGHGRHLPGESEGKLWMWSRCGKCEPDKEKATKRVLISTAARGLSFGKFLELSFSSHSSFNRLSSCGHSFQKDFLYFFGLGAMVAMFQYSRVATYTVSVPAQKLEFHSSIKEDWLQSNIDSVRDKGLLLFDEVANYLKKIESGFSGWKLVFNGSSKAFADIMEMLKLEKSEFEENIKNIGISDESSHNSVHRLLSLNRLRWEILLEACVWDRRLQLLLSSSSTLACSTTSNDVPQKQMDMKEDSSARGEAEQLQTAAEGLQEAADEAVQEQMEKDHTQGRLLATDILVEGKEGSEDHSAGEVESPQKAAASGHDAAILEGEKLVDVEVQVETITGADKVSVQELPDEGTDQVGRERDLRTLSVIDEDAQRLTSGNSVPSVSSQDTERTGLPSNGDSHHTDSMPLSSDTSEDGSTVIIADQEDSNISADKDASQILASPPLSSIENSRGWVWNPFTQIREDCMKDLHKRYLPKFGHLPKFELLHSSDFLPAVSQVIIDEGLRLHIPVSNGDYIVSDYDGELSSPIACALSLMKDLTSPASDSGENVTLKRASSEPSSWPPGTPNDSDTTVSTPSMPQPESRFSSFDGLNLLGSLVSYGQLHPEITLGIEKYPIKGKYSVVVMYASEFLGLRNHCCPSELDYITSLSRCKIWDAKGGKSKSVFAKSLDDRLIIKEIKKTEFESFMKFAPEYFNHMKDSFKTGNQTCLAKILGIYQVTIRHPKTGKETKHDLMVQENLSFGRNITRQYDLKGALHARFTATDGTGDVLLDQNFVNDMNSSPLYIGQKSKRLLQRAVWNDTTFLDKINVMDYSLLVGVDRTRRGLVCGIIDYLRQYTWDKQLETWVKTSLVVPKNVLPTIISPKEYKKRFRKFMDTHFLTVPDHWCSQRSSNPCKLCGIKVEGSALMKLEKREEPDISSP